MASILITIELNSGISISSEKLRCKRILRFGEAYTGHIWCLSYPILCGALTTVSEVIFYIAMYSTPHKFQTMHLTASSSKSCLGCYGSQYSAALHFP